MEAPKIKITPEMMKGFKTITCDCGGQLFKHGMVIKVIPSLISPTGSEEPYPLDVLICTKCGKVPNELNTQGILPDEVLAVKFDGGGFN